MSLAVPQFRVSPLLGDIHSLPMPPNPTADARSCALDATSTDAWGPSHSLMEELRVYTQTRYCADILHVLHDALTSRGLHWRRVLKALTTIAHCMRQGSKEVTLFATAHRALIKQLTRFEYLDAYRLDRGAAVREEAEVVVTLLHQSRSEDSRSTFVRYPSRDGSTPGQSTSSATPSAHTSRRHHTPYPPFATNTTQLFACSPWSAPHAPPPTPQDIAQELFRDSTTLAAHISRIEASDSDACDSDDTWLNIYKLLFLLNTSLPTASDDTIRHWLCNAHLLKRLGGRHHTSRVSPTASHAEDTVASEVRRLAAELAGIFDGATVPREVRRRARMF